MDMFLMAFGSMIIVAFFMGMLVISISLIAVFFLWVKKLFRRK